MYKIHLNTVPQYLCDTIASIRKNVQYKTRKEDKYIHVVPKCTLDIYKK